MVKYNLAYTRFRVECLYKMLAIMSMRWHWWETFSLQNGYHLLVSFIPL